MYKWRAGINKAISIVLIVVIAVAAALGVLYVVSSSLPLKISVASSASVGTAGSPISFSVLPSLSQATITSVLWSFGDGSNTTTTGPSTSHSYANGGYYLVLAQVTATYNNFVRTFVQTVSNSKSLFPVQIQSNLTLDQSQKASVPTINFPVAQNPKAPIFNVNEKLNPVGGFLESPGNSSWTAQKYMWNFGNGQTQTVQANSTGSGLPLKQITISYSSPGLYPVSLTLTTNSSDSTFSVTTVSTVAVNSTDVPFALLVSSGGIINPKVITSAEVSPGGPYSFDPQIDNEVVGLEILANVYQNLVFYNGSSTTSFVPVLATELPSQQNGRISSDLRTYNFTVRNDQYFTNGDKVTAYDVWYSFARSMAFIASTPGTQGWIIDQYLIPGAQNGTVNIYTANTWKAATSTVTYNNATNSVVFHFNRPMPPTLAFQVLSPPYYGAIDAKYAASVGAGLSQSNWDDYKNQGNVGSYNAKMQWNPVTSGPYMISTYVPGQSIELVPNPKYGGVPGIPPVTKTVVIDWVKTPDTALLMLQDGQADTVVHLPPSDFPSIQQLQAQGRVKIYDFPSQGIYQFNFNIFVNKSLESSQFGSNYNEPANYFADAPTRMTWINAWDYQGFLDNILGNQKYNAKFGQGYVGAIPPGMVYFVPPSQLGGLPKQNLNFAKANFSISAWRDTKITVPIVVITGDPVTLAGAQEWAATLNQISGGNITGVPVQITFSQFIGYMAQNLDPMAVAWDNYIPDYPYPTDSVGIIWQEGGFDAAGLNWAVSNFKALPPAGPNDMVHVNGTAYPQDVVYGWLNGNATLAATSNDPVVIQKAFKITSVLAVDMGLDVYFYLQQSFFFWGPDIGGFQYQQSPMFGANGILLFYWMSKG